MTPRPRLRLVRVAAVRGDGGSLGRPIILARELARCADYVEGREQFEQQAVLAEYRHDVLREDRARQKDHRTECHDRPTFVDDLLPQRPVRYRPGPQNGARQDAQTEHVGCKLRGQQVSNLGAVRLKNVTQHVAIDDRAVFAAEVGGARGAEQQQGGDGLQYIREGDGTKQQTDH